MPRRYKILIAEGWKWQRNFLNTWMKFAREYKLSLYRTTTTSEAQTPTYVEVLPSCTHCRWMNTNNTARQECATLIKFCTLCVCCVFSPHPFWASSSLDAPAGVTQEEGHTGFLIHLPSAVLALIFVARRIQPFLSLVDREVEFCVLTN